MIPRRFISQMERSLNRPLAPDEIEVVNRARAACRTGKRDSVKAMRAALEAHWENQTNSPLSEEFQRDGGPSAMGWKAWTMTSGWDGSPLRGQIKVGKKAKG